MRPSRPALRAPLAAALLCAAASTVPPPARAAPPASAGRAVVALDDGWQVAPGRAEQASRFESVAVPAPFEEALGVDFDGVATYRRALRVPSSFAGRRVLLEFEAAMTHTRVFLDGELVGTHEGGWTPFRIDLTGRVRPGGEHTLLVEVDEAPGHDTQGFLPVIQPHFGGLWGPVRLLALPDPHLDDLSLLALGDAARRAVVLEAPVVGDARGARVFAEIDIEGETFRGEVPPGRSLLPVERFRLWEPGDPHLYTLRLSLERDGRLLDRVEAKVAFRCVRTAGRHLLVNGRPFVARGILDWGWRPPALAPRPTAAEIEQEVREARRRGFNLVKFCLWLPPRHVLETLDRLGMPAWIEYPTWHARFDAERAALLERSFEAWFRHDRNHPCVLVRSLTCETGTDASLDLLRSLYRLAKERIPGAVVEDNSSWITWNRIHDFWDDHPYGNCDDFPARLDSLRTYAERHGLKPLLLGEAIAADTWIDLEGAPPDAWWTSIHREASAAWRDRLAARFGADAARRLGPDSLRFARAQRKDQIEHYRLLVPGGGYVVSAARDFRLAEMGLMDPRGRWKWSADAWAFHGDTMLLLGRETPRSVESGAEVSVDLHLAHAGRAPLPPGAVRWEAAGLRGTLRHGGVAPGQVARLGTIRIAAPEGRTRFRLRVETADGGARNEWTFWSLPPPEGEAPGVTVCDRLTPELLDEIAAGGRAICLAGDRPSTFRAPDLWLLRGSLWFPDDPVLPSSGSTPALPTDLFLDLCVRDLHPVGLLPLADLWPHVRPIVGFWENHDLPEVRDHALAWETRLGEGRLLVTALPTGGPAGRSVLDAFARHLALGPAPEERLPDEWIASLRDRLEERSLDLTRFEWRFRPEGAGEWTPIRIGRSWESQGFATLDGWAAYRLEIDLPGDMAGGPLYLHLEGVDDAYVVLFDGREVGRGGDIETRRTAFDEPASFRLAERAESGRHTLELRVYDWYGAGGIHRPATLSTRPRTVAWNVLHPPR